MMPQNAAGSPTVSTPVWTMWSSLVQEQPISVDGSNPTNPKLVRTTATGTDVIAEQIIGFTVGAWSSKTAGYSLDPASLRQRLGIDPIATGSDSRTRNP